MPFWGWLCIGALGLTILIFVIFYIIAVLPYNRMKKRLEQKGHEVVGKIFLANPSLYESRPALLEAAFVVFTLDNDSSEEHLAELQSIVEKLDDFVPDDDNPDEKKLASALKTQRTVGYAIRLPSSVTGGRKAFFATPNVYRRMLPEGKLTKDYLHLRVLVEDGHRDVEMIDYPETSEPGKRKSPKNK